MDLAVATSQDPRRNCLSVSDIQGLVFWHLCKALYSLPTHPLILGVPLQSRRGVHDPAWLDLARFLSGGMSRILSSSLILRPALAYFIRLCPLASRCFLCRWTQKAYPCLLHQWLSLFDESPPPLLFKRLQVLLRRILTTRVLDQPVLCVWFQRSVTQIIPQILLMLIQSFSSWGMWAPLSHL